MEANKYGFKTQSLPCEFGVCDEESQCSDQANTAGSMAYGSGPEYLIDTMLPFKVKSQFNKSGEGFEGTLECITTTLMQGDKEHVLHQMCKDYLSPLNIKL